MKKLRNKILAVMVSVLMIAAYLPANALPVFADDATVTGIEITTPPTVTAYHVGDRISFDGMVVTAVYSDGTEAEVTDYTVDIGTAHVGDFAFTVFYGDLTAVQPITVTDHQYIDHVCAEERCDGTVCGAEEPFVTFIGASGQDYTIWYSTVDALDDDNTTYIWNSQTEVNAAYFSDVLAAIGADQDTGDCAIYFAAGDGYGGALKANWYPEMGLFITEDGQIRSIMMNAILYINDRGEPSCYAVMPDGTEVIGGWYSPSGLTTITGMDHSYGEKGICDNKIKLGNGKYATSPCNTFDPEAEAYVIDTADDFAAVAKEVNGGNSFEGKAILLGADTDLSALQEWTPIGTSSAAFAGTFDGQGYTISGLTITDGAGGYKGLFGNNAGTVKNFTISGSIGSPEACVGGSDYYGAIAYNTGTVSDVISYLALYPGGSGETYAVGGVVGKNEGTVERCGFEGVFAADTSKDVRRAGGIVGSQTAGSITECYNHSDISSWNYRNGAMGTGGILGSMEGGTVSYCYSTGEIQNGLGDSSTGGKNGTGGIVGGIENGSVDHCYATGNVYGPASAGIVIGKVGNGTYDHLFSLYSARAYNDKAGTQIDPEREVGNKYLDGLDENLDGTLKFGAAGIANSYNPGYTISNSYTRTTDEMIDPAFAEEINDGDAMIFVANCGFPVLYWEETKAHTEEIIEEETPAAYAVQGYIETVVRCSVCGLELSREWKEDTDPSLKDQAAAAFAEAQAAADEAKAHTGEAAVTYAQAAIDAANTASEKAQIALAAAPEEYTAEAQAAVDSAEGLITEMETFLSSAEKEADEAADVRDAAVATLAQLDGTVDKALYTASTYAVYKEAFDEFKALVLNDEATTKQLRAARSAVTRAYTQLELKDSQTLTLKATAKSVGYATTAAGAKTYSMITVSGAVDGATVKYSKSSGSSYLTVNSSTGKITIKKGTPAGTYTATIKVSASATDDFLAASKTVKVTVTVTKAAQPMTASGSTKSVAYSKVKTANQTVTGAITVSKAQGTVTYSKTSGNSKITINSTTGKITVKKGLAKGKYVVKIKVSAAGNKNYKAGSKTVSVTINVK